MKNPKTIVVNFSGAPVTLNFVDNVQAIVQAWFPERECGHSVVRVLKGMVNPSGGFQCLGQKELRIIRPLGISQLRIT
jgi:hypothetical protein